MFAALRPTSRVVLISSQHTVLMLFTRAPDSSNWSRWVLPGGGVDPGESHEQAALRELAEETGLRLDQLGPRVFVEDVPLPYDEAIYPGAHQEYFLARIDDEFEPDRAGWTETEHVDVTRWQWWTIEALESTTQPFEPRGLPDILRQWVASTEGEAS